jgi:hypothetical protein
VDQKKAAVLAAAFKAPPQSCCRQPRAGVKTIIFPLILPGLPLLGDLRTNGSNGRNQPPLPTWRMGALSTMCASFSVSFPCFSSALIWSSCPSRTGLTPFFQVSQTSAQSGL